MINKIKKKWRDIQVGFSLGLASADKEIMSSSFSKLPEAASIINPSYSRNSFLRSVQLGQLKEEQLQRYYEVLNSIDYIHGKTKVEWIEMVVEDLDDDGKPIYKDGERVYKKMLLPFVRPMYPEEVLALELAKQQLGDYIEGYETNLWITNKEILLIDAGNLNPDLSILTEDELYRYNQKGFVHRSTLSIEREARGVIRIEDFTNEVFVKVEIDRGPIDRSCILQFYCVNYNIKQKQLENDNGLHYEDKFQEDEVFNKINEGLNLTGFIDFEKLKLTQTSATRNDIPHTFEILNFIEIKKFGKGFVVKFNALQS